VDRANALAQSLPFPEVRPDAFGQPGEPAVLGSEPEGAPRIHRDRTNAVGLERADPGLVENLEADAVETRHPFVGSYPEIPVGRLRDTEDPVLGKPPFIAPQLKAVLGEPTGGVERKSGERGQTSGQNRGGAEEGVRAR
jgi:hypothetical protein